jgi:hypothetical protein
LQSTAIQQPTALPLAGTHQHVDNRQQRHLLEISSNSTTDSNATCWQLAAIQQQTALPLAGN